MKRRKGLRLLLLQFHLIYWIAMIKSYVSTRSPKYSKCGTDSVVTVVKEINISREVAAVADKMGRHDVSLHNLREADELTGISDFNGGKASLICEELDDSVFGPVYYHFYFTINEVSYSAAKDFSHKSYQREDENIFRVQLVKNGDTYIFRRRHGIYVHNLRDKYDITRNKHAHVTMVEKNKAHFT